MCGKWYKYPETGNITPVREVFCFTCEMKLERYMVLKWIVEMGGTEMKEIEKYLDEFEKLREKDDE